MRISLDVLSLCLFFACALARRQLKATSLVPCMANSQLTATTFNVTFDPDSRALTYDLDLNSEINDYVTAKIEVYAYGFKVIEKTINLCSLSFKQFCPLYSGQVVVDSTEYLNKKYADMIPGIAYTVPDIDAYVKVRVEDDSGKDLACMAAYFDNGKTVSHVGAKWATAVVAGLGLLVSALLSTFGNSNAASHISVNALALFSYFQSVVTSAMLHVDTMPPIASAWAENLAWSMGLIRVEFMQKIFRWYVQATGGSPTLYFREKNKAVLVQRAVEYLRKRAPALVVHSSSKLTVLRGIKRIGYNAKIEITSIVVTGFTFFVLCGYVLAGVILVSKLVLEGLVRAKVIKNPATAFYFRSNWKTIMKGALLRYIAIGFTQLTIFSLWEFTQRDSPAVIILAILFLAMAVGISSWAAYRAFYFGRTSVATYKNPAAILYGNQNVLDKYGFSYTMYNANMYWWGGVFLIFNLVKAIFVGLCQASGKTQSFVIWLLDMAYLAGVIKYKPYLDRPTNILNIVISTVVCLNSFFFVFFSDLFNQPGAVSSVMGWVFFILNAAFSLILLIVIIVYIAIALLSKVPDARFRRAGDDRTSFQRNSTLLMDEKSIDGNNSSAGGAFNNGNNVTGTPNPGAEELLDLGLVAKNHQNNWEDEIYRLKDMVSSKGDLLGGETEESLQSKSKSQIERLRTVNRTSSSNINDLDYDDAEAVEKVKPLGAGGAGASAAGAGAAAAFGSKIARTLSFKKNNAGGGAYNSAANSNSANPVASLTRKLSAIKLSKANSLSRNNGNASNANYTQIPTLSNSNALGSPPQVSPSGAVGSAGAVSANVTKPSRINSAAANNSFGNHQRTLSATPINSPTDDDEFNFLDTPGAHGGVNSGNVDYSNYNNYANKPATTANFIDSGRGSNGYGNQVNEAANASPVRRAQGYDSEEDINKLSYGKKF